MRPIVDVYTAGAFCYRDLYRNYIISSSISLKVRDESIEVNSCVDVFSLLYTVCICESHLYWHGLYPWGDERSDRRDARRGTTSDQTQIRLFSSAMRLDCCHFGDLLVVLRDAHTHVSPGRKDARKCFSICLDSHNGPPRSNCRSDNHPAGGKSYHISESQALLPQHRAVWFFEKAIDCGVSSWKFVFSSGRAAVAWTVRKIEQQVSGDVLKVVAEARR